ncbi:hypothetical protein [Leptolyngbya sp. FACHB-261]|uniref:hypothetical protein n=1 Tax=Leptolyngbya sp. FACHB-261 TaxID=2692806 RepID=UPI001684761A|nr:hypothetical protein [Leptolyngbya sp. FACHB-261]MBD2104195.1 hypothetical protein [Leptolyngbya sp. FACHB-261]
MSTADSEQSKSARGTAARMRQAKARRKRLIALGVAGISTALVAVGAGVLLQKQQEISKSTPQNAIGENAPVERNWPAAWASNASARPLGTEINGITCDAAEGVVEHTHQYLNFVVDGKTVYAPANVGINPQGPCLYWLHSHSPDGIIHVEAPQKRSFVLGQFLDIWRSTNTVDQNLLSSVVAAAKPSQVWLNGSLYQGNPWEIPLTEKAQITVVYGKPITQPVPFTFPSGL